MIVKVNVSFHLLGKQVIHPGQIDVVQSAYSPSLESIEWAEELIRIFKEHQQFGKVCRQLLMSPHYHIIRIQ